MYLCKPRQIKKRGNEEEEVGRKEREKESREKDGERYWRESQMCVHFPVVPFSPPSLFSLFHFLPFLFCGRFSLSTMVSVCYRGSKRSTWCHVQGVIPARDEEEGNRKETPPRNVTRRKKSPKSLKRQRQTGRRRTNDVKARSRLCILLCETSGREEG